MAKAPWVNKSGAGVDLDAEAFGAPFNEALIHEAVRAELNARRQGSAATLTRARVRGGGTKPWRQKGTGRARAGSIRSPIWTGGGVVFGPQPRHYTFKVNRKARRAALRSALSVHAERGSIAVLDGGAFDEPSTKSAAAALAKWDQPAPTLVVLGEDEAAVGRSFRNLSDVTVLAAAGTGVADLIGAASLVVSEAALAELTGRAKGEKTAEEAA
jgi:large subunit ribosomal protein L4